MPAPAALAPPAAAPDSWDEEQEEAQRQRQGQQDGEGDHLSSSLALAEDFLHDGELSDAEGFAWRALRCPSAEPGDVTRAFCVLLQCDFEARRCGVVFLLASGRRRRRARYSPSPPAVVPLVLLRSANPSLVKKPNHHT